MIHKFFVMLTVLFLLLNANSTFAEETVFQIIGPVNYNGNSNTAFFRGASRWGAVSCPNAIYVQITSSVSGRKEMLSLALAAKMAGKRVQFWGACNADNNYFDAMYIIVE